MKDDEKPNKYQQYRYFCGQKDNPFETAGFSHWWKWERDHFEQKIKVPFDEYLKSWFRKHDDENVSEKYVEERWQCYLSGRLDPFDNEVYKKKGAN